MSVSFFKSMLYKEKNRHETEDTVLMAHQMSLGLAVQRLPRAPHARSATFACTSHFAVSREQGNRVKTAGLRLDRT